MKKQKSEAEQTDAAKKSEGRTLPGWTLAQPSILGHYSASALSRQQARTPAGHGAVLLIRSTFSERRRLFFLRCRLFSPFPPSVLHSVPGVGIRSVVPIMSPARRDRSRRRGQAALASLLTATLWFASEAAADSQHHPGAHLQRIRDGHARHHALADRFLPEDSPAGIDKRALIGKVGKAEHAAHHAQHQKHQQHGNGTIAAAHGKSGTSKVAKDHQTSQGYPGRYGQTTIAVPAGTDVGDAFAAPNSTSVLFIGGQVTGAGTYISNDVLHLSPRLPFAGPRADHPNPVLVPGLSNGLPPRAWGVGSMDAAGRVWVIGGVVEDCKKDAGAYVWIFRKNSTGVEWSPLTLAEPPARRRQADLITIIRRNYTATANHSHSPADTPPASPNVDEYPLSVATSNDTAIENTDCDFIIPGGIAEPYTCSPETVAYLGVDRWSPPSAKVGLNSTTVSTGGMPDPLPPPTYQVLHGPNGTLTVGQFNGTNATTSAGVATANVTVSNVTITHTHGKKTPGRKGPHPPITDYAMGLVDQRWVLIVGGQVTNGTLARTDEVAVLDTLFNEWSVIVRVVFRIPPAELGLNELFSAAGHWSCARAANGPFFDPTFRGHLPALRWTVLHPLPALRQLPPRYDSDPLAMALARHLRATAQRDLLRSHGPGRQRVGTGPRVPLGRRPQRDRSPDRLGHGRGQPTRRRERRVLAGDSLRWDCHLDAHGHPGHPQSSPQTGRCRAQVCEQGCRLEHHHFRGHVVPPPWFEQEARTVSFAFPRDQEQEQGEGKIQELVDSGPIPDLCRKHPRLGRRARCY